MKDESQENFCKVQALQHQKEETQKFLIPSVNNFTSCSTNVQHSQDISKSAEMRDDNLPPPESPSVQPGQSYENRKSEASYFWRISEDASIDAHLNSLVYDNEKCSICNSSDGIFQCQDCGNRTCCLACLEDIHSKVKLHKPTKWNGVYYEDFCVDHLFVFKSGHTCDTQYFSGIGIFDIKGRNHERCILSLCKCWCITSQLYSYGLWPNSPSNPEVAFDTDLLHIIESLQVEAKVSLYGICSALKFSGKSHWKLNSDMYRPLSILESFQEFKFLSHRLRTLFVDDGTTCPCCYRNKNRIYIMDGNFAAVHKKSASKYFTESRVSNLLYKSVSNDDMKYVPVDDGCRTFKAGEYLRSRETRKKLDVQGIFGVVCRHEFWKLLMDMATGERYAYAVEAIRSLYTKDEYVAYTFVYDIACKLAVYMRNRPQLAELLSGIRLCIDQFHAYGHSSECQLFRCIRSTSGVGLTCGSQVERQWPVIRRTAPQTKEMSLSHRKDFLTSSCLHENWKQSFNIANNLRRKLKLCDKVLEENEAKFSDLRTQLMDQVPLTDGNILRWERLERSRYIPDNSLSPRQKLLKQLQDLAVEREYLLNTIKRYPIGQKVNIRLNKQLHKQEKQRSKILRDLNKCGQRVTKLQAINPLSSVFSSINEVSSASNDVPRTFRLEAIRLYHLKKRANEEKCLIRDDAVSAVAFYTSQLDKINYHSASDPRICAHVVHLRQILIDRIQSFQPFVNSEVDSITPTEDNSNTEDDIISDSDSSTNSSVCSSSSSESLGK